MIRVSKSIEQMDRIAGGEMRVIEKRKKNTSISIIEKKKKKDVSLEYCWSVLETR